MKDLNLLFVFEALWRDRSVTAAAERLGLTQAAVSSSLKRLRDEYDDRLFMLVGRRMEPTPLAEELAPQLLEAMSLVRRTALERIRFDAASARRLFTVRTRDIGEALCLPSVLDALSREAPTVRLRTVNRSAQDTLAGMASGQIDLALGFLPALENGIHRRLLFTQHHVCLMRRGHPLEHVELTAERFSEQEHVLVEAGASGHAHVERALLDGGLKTRIKVRLPQYLAAAYVVERSDMLWSVPTMLADDVMRRFSLISRPHPLQLPSFEVALYWHERCHRDPANRWVRDLFSRALSEHLRTPVI